MSFRTRNLARLCAATALAAGATGLMASPALAAADSADLSLAYKGTTLSVGSNAKDSIVAFKNDGPSVAKNWYYEADLSALDTSKVRIPKLEGCEVQGDIIGCEYDEKLDLAVGETFEDILPLEKVPNAAAGPAGSVKLTILSDTADPNGSNNSVTVPVTVSAATGPDIQVITPDIGTEAEPLKPGSDTEVLSYLQNAGTDTVTGLTFAITLPQGVSFKGEAAECVYAGQTATCTLGEGFSLIPAERDTAPDDAESAYFEYRFPVTIAADAKGPVLKGGTTTATVTSSTEYQETAALMSARGGRGGHDWECGGPVDEPEVPETPKGEVDGSDNSDDFVALVKVSGGNGGGNGNGNGGGGGGGTDEPGLPVTGAQTAVIGGVGAAVVVAGAAMFMVARRRRVVTVTPGDENTAV